MLFESSGSDNTLPGVGHQSVKQMCSLFPFTVSLTELIKTFPQLAPILFSTI